MGERRGTRGLELWCRRMTDGYPGVKVENMTTSWRDGLAFCAMIHHFRPDLIDFSKLNKDDIYYNNELAFRVAEQYLGIPALLDPNDMVVYEEPDRLSILTYLSQFYQVFESSQAKSLRAASVKRPTPPADLKPTLSSSPSPTKKVDGARDRCAKCALPVFFAERLLVERALYHRTCFRCARCGAQLAPGAFYETETGDHCCETCPDEDVLNQSLSDEEKARLASPGGSTSDSSARDPLPTSFNPAPGGATKDSEHSVRENERSLSEETQPLEENVPFIDDPPDGVTSTTDTTVNPQTDSISVEDVSSPTNEVPTVIKEYPDDLNPFGEEEHVQEEVSLNPFDESDDDDTNPFAKDEDVPVVPVRKLLKAPRITLTPHEEYFKRIDEESKNPATDQHTEYLKDEISPSLRTKRSPGFRFTLTPEECRALRAETGDGDNVSLFSTGSSRKKKPAPKPPTNDSPFSSLNSSPCHSQLTTPRSTPKFRKLKKAPPPPSSTPLNNEPKEFKSELPEQSEYISKPDKSTYGKWKRRKGQAPSKPIPIKRTIKSLPMSQIKSELEAIEVQMRGLEKQGVTLEEIIRDRTESPGKTVESSISRDVDDMIIQLFELVNEKNELFRKQAELMYLRKQQRLEEEHADIEYKIRCLLLKSPSTKTDSEKKQEEELIQRLVTIVESRNEIIESLEMDRVREVNEDHSISHQMTLYTAKRDDAGSSPTSDTKKHKKKSKKDRALACCIDSSQSLEGNETKKDKKKKILSLFKKSH